MLTQCPGCQTVFRVTSVILRAAHGQVRCGRCEAQFDAIEHLLDGDDSTLEMTSTLPAPVGDPAENLTHEDIVLEGNRIEISGVYQRIDAANADEQATHSHTVIEEFNIDTEEWENPFAQESAADNDSEALNADETELEDIEQEITAASIADAMASLDTEQNQPISSVATTHAARAPADEHLSDEGLSDKSQVDTPIFARAIGDAPLQRPYESRLAEFSDPSLFGENEATRRWPWVLASIVLMLGLTAQVIHHSRNELARHPSFGPALSTLYASLGMPLIPKWQLQAYSIKQWGIVSDPNEPGTLRVRASVTNGANFAQPYPLLQLSLEDRFGSQVGMRAFTPGEYLNNSAQATRLLAAGEAANIDLAIVDPGEDAIGFQFDTCLALRDGTRCTHQLQLPPT